MKSLGRHLIAELYGCDKKTLSAVDKVQRMMVSAAKAAHATVIDSIFHRFSPCGVSGVVVIEESHFAIHTWPEHGYASVDLFTCGAGTKPWEAFKRLKKDFKADHFSVIRLERGLIPDEPRAGGQRGLPHAPALSSGWIGTAVKGRPEGGWAVDLLTRGERRVIRREGSRK